MIPCFSCIARECDEIPKYVCPFLEDYHREQELIQIFERMFGETPTTADISYLKLLDK